jgi:hypothetical protein
MTPRPNVPGVPNQEATPRRTVRVSDEVWEAAQRVAADRGETVTDVIVRALIRYVRDHPDDG